MSSVSALGEATMPPRDPCWLCRDLGGITIHDAATKQFGEPYHKPLFIPHEPESDTHPVLPCPACFLRAVVLRPQVNSDPDANAVYLTITNKPVARTVEAIPGEVNIDYDTDGTIVGAEFLEVLVPPGGRWLVTRADIRPPVRQETPPCGH